VIVTSTLRMANETGHAFHANVTLVGYADGRRYAREHALAVGVREIAPSLTYTVDHCALVVSLRMADGDDRWSDRPTVVDLADRRPDGTFSDVIECQ